jgi:uncharacterized protein YigA (DUF484 family)
MTEKRFNLVDLLETLAIADGDECKYYQNCNDDFMSLCKELNALHEENQQLKSDLARVIEQARKNNELCISDIRILEKALWCSSCENDYNRLSQLRKEFLK